MSRRSGRTVPHTGRCGGRRVRGVGTHSDILPEPGTEAATLVDGRVARFDFRKTFCSTHTPAILVLVVLGLSWRHSRRQVLLLLGCYCVRFAVLLASAAARASPEGRTRVSIAQKPAAPLFSGTMWPAASTSTHVRGPSVFHAPCPQERC